jgi:hypothetical protein
VAIEKEKPKKSHKDVLAEARERFKLAEEGWKDVREAALEDLKFSAGDQWPEKIKEQRKREDRPCLTINKTPQQIRSITNEQRQNKQSIMVSPVDDVGDPEVARVLKGMIRQIENDSNAESAYGMGFDGAVRKGFGFWRVITEYVSPRSFDQQLKIKSIRNAFSVYLDPHIKEPDGSDAAFGFIIDDVPKDSYKNENPGSELSKKADWGSVTESIPGWISESTCRIAEYFTKEFEEIELVLLSDGSVLTSEELNKAFPAGSLMPEGLTVKDKRKTLEPTIKWYKINGIEVLEETTFPGEWIPIVPCFGDILDIEGKLVLESVFRHAKDSQRMYNLWASAESEAIGLAPKAPWIIAEGQITEENESQWATANSRTHAFLQYSPIDVNGQVLPPPQRNSFEPAVQAITNARMQAAEDMKATTGIYDAALGARSNETSGIAIKGRQQQAQTSNFHFADNQTKSIKHTGRILVGAIPHVYDTARIARIIGDEGEDEIVKINQVFEEHGEHKEINLNKGKYDVTVDIGPSFQTKRQEAVSSMLELAQIMPQQTAMFLDLLIKNMDMPGAKEMAERVKKGLPPGIAEDSKDQAPIPPEVQAQMQQMSQMVEQLTTKLNEATDAIKTKSIELESRERVELWKLETQLKIKALELASNETQAVMALQQQFDEINQRQALLHPDEPIAANFNGSGPEQAEYPTEQPQPTGGLAPGPNMGV